MKPCRTVSASTRTMSASTRTLSARTRTLSAVPEPCRPVPELSAGWPADMVRVLAPTWFGYCRHGSGTGRHGSGTGDKVRVLADMHRVLADMHRVLADMHWVSGVGRPLRVSPIGHHRMPLWASVGSSPALTLFLGVVRIGMGCTDVLHGIRTWVPVALWKYMYKSVLC